VLFQVPPGFPLEKMLCPAFAFAATELLAAPKFATGKLPLGRVEAAAAEEAFQSFQSFQLFQDFF
jgi:hypothetical protein